MTHSIHILVTMVALLLCGWGEWGANGYDQDDGIRGFQLNRRFVPTFSKRDSISEKSQRASRSNHLFSRPSHWPQPRQNHWFPTTDSNQIKRFGHNYVPSDYNKNEYPINEKNSLNARQFPEQDGSNALKSRDELLYSGTSVESQVRLTRHNSVPHVGQNYGRSSPYQRRTHQGIYRRDGIPMSTSNYAGSMAPSDRLAGAAINLDIAEMQNDGTAEEQLQTRTLVSDISDGLVNRPTVQRNNSLDPFYFNDDYSRMSMPSEIRNTDVDNIEILDQNSDISVTVDNINNRSDVTQNAETEGQSNSNRRRERQRRNRNRSKKRKGGKNRKKNKGGRRKNRRRDKRNKIDEVLANKSVILHEVNGQPFLDCCPSKLVVVEKQVGKARNEHAVELHPDSQLFYERVCMEEFEGTECVFPAKALKSWVETRCAQTYSYSQALVRPFDSNDDWALDFIEVSSGCSCQVNVSPRERNEDQVAERDRTKR